MDNTRINLYDMLLCLSNAVDLITPELYNHHQQVAYLAYRIAEHKGLPKTQQQNIFIAALLHDVGALKANDRLEIFEYEPLNVNSHAFLGAKLFEAYEPLNESAEIIRFHHLPWNYGEGITYMGKDVPFASHIIHLADRTCVAIKKDSNVLTQIPKIISDIQAQAGSVFEPELVKSLTELSKTDFIWLELTNRSPLDNLSDMNLFDLIDLELDDVIQVAKIISRVIDFRSHFTATHSAGVAKIAEKLGELIGFSCNECKMLLVAGYLHDLGKLTIDDSILEKPSKLNEEEFNQIRTHSFYTYQLLRTVRGFATINQWASYHHEKLNGIGYPFHLMGNDISLGSRIVAVADVFTAITEHRPYRRGMNQDQIMGVLRSMEENELICHRVVSVLIKNFEMLTEICKESQLQASLEYDQFFAI